MRRCTKVEPIAAATMSAASGMCNQLSANTGTRSSPVRAGTSGASADTPRITIR